MDDCCENLEKCGFFNNLKSNTEVIKQGWVRMYCQSKEKSERCARKKIKRYTGVSPADNISPTGTTIYVSGQD